MPRCSAAMVSSQQHTVDHSSVSKLLSETMKCFPALILPSAAVCFPAPKFPTLHRHTATLPHCHTATVHCHTTLPHYTATPPQCTATAPERGLDCCGLLLPRQAGESLKSQGNTVIHLHFRLDCVKRLVCSATCAVCSAQYSVCIVQLALCSVQ